ncbi:MAG: signal peptidase II [Myxococcota bacterium]
MSETDPESTPEPEPEAEPEPEPEPEASSEPDPEAEPEPEPEPEAEPEPVPEADSPAPEAETSGNRATANPDAPPRTPLLVLTAVVFALSLGADLWSKAWAWNTIKPPGKPVMVWEPHFEFSYSFNTGAAFGFLNRFGWAREFFIVVTLIAMAYMLWLALRMPTTRRYGFVAIALVASGAAGNLHDRLVRVDAGGRYGVVDFLKVNYPWGGSWPTFNIADVVLLVGVGLLFIYIRNHVETAPPTKS